MNTKSSFSPEIARLENEFRQLRQSEFEQYEANYKHAMEMLYEPDLELVEKSASEESKILKKAGIDMDRLRELDQEEGEHAGKHLENARSVLIRKEPYLDEVARERLVWISRNNALGAKSLPLIGADRIAFKPVPSPSSWGEVIIDKEAHEWGETAWFQPDRQVNIKSVHKCTHINCLAAIGGSQNKVDFWFYYDAPPADGSYWIVCMLPYRGFYAVNSNKKGWNCREAHVEAKTTLKIHQGTWIKEIQQTIIKAGGTNISKIGNIIGTAEFDFNQQLLHGIPTWIKLSFEINAWTRYTGTYAEINFSDGDANFIDSPVLMIAL